ncbi:hypothetical protein ACFQV2_03710 [Actinokineospora soli]|uniref:Protein kinase domain-containing protein n=1 Tax=Actinokineospora soli TaxID=1048753 RepID=A0ABW2TGM7_9PSEU
MLEQRVVQVNGSPYVRKYVSRDAAAREPWRYDRLVNEIRAGTRLAQVYGPRVPDELPWLVAYNIDAEEPFALLRAYHGYPVVDQVARFGPAEQRQFEVGLFRAVHLAACAEVVHGNLSLDHLRWDAGKVQIVDFESAARVGEPRRTGGGPVDARDDLWNAAAVLRRVVLGAVTGDPPPRAQDPERLRALLSPVFDQPVELRPRTADMLIRLRVDPDVRGTDPEAVLAAGRAAFDRVSAAKRAPRAAEPDVPRDRPRRMLRLFFGLFVLFFVLVVIGVISQ